MEVIIAATNYPILFYFFFKIIIIFFIDGF